MTSCKHSSLELLPERRSGLRCRHCHLTISAEELGYGYCPECFDHSGARRYDFELLENNGREIVRYRCEECGAIISGG